MAGAGAEVVVPSAGWESAVIGLGDEIRSLRARAVEQEAVIESLRNELASTMVSLERVTALVQTHIRSAEGQARRRSRGPWRFESAWRRQKAQKKYSGLMGLGRRAASEDSRHAFERGTRAASEARIPRACDLGSHELQHLQGVARRTLVPLDQMRWVA